MKFEWTQSRNVKTPIKEYIEYMATHRLQGVILIVIIALVYAKMAFSNDFYVDAEVIINNPGTIYNWGDIGRFGLIALKYINGANWYNPYYLAVLFLVTQWLVAMAVCYLFELVTQKNDTSVSVIFASLWIIFPTYADQYMFRFQFFEISFAMLMIIFGTRYFISYFREANIFCLIVAIILEVFSLGIYQSMANLQICFLIAIYLFHIRGTNAKSRQRLIILSLIYFISGFIIYEVIAKLFFSGSDYLDNQIGWFNGQTGVTIRNLLAYIKHILLATDTFYPITYLVTVISGFVLLVYVLIKEKGYFVPHILGIAGMLASPFMLAIITGTPTAYRAQCMLPFCCAVMWLYMMITIIDNLEVNKVRSLFKTIWTVIGLILILSQSAILLRMFYTQDTIRKADYITSIDIMTRINKCDSYNNKPIIFVGKLEAKQNKSCYTKEQVQSFLAYSLFEFAYVDGVPIDNPNYYNTERILGYFETLGFDYLDPTEDIVRKAETVAIESNMAVWPLEDAVLDLEDMIVIRLN